MIVNRQITAPRPGRPSRAGMRERKGINLRADLPDAAGASTPVRRASSLPSAALAASRALRPAFRPRECLPEAGTAAGACSHPYGRPCNPGRASAGLHARPGPRKNNRALKSPQKTRRNRKRRRSRRLISQSLVLLVPLPVSLVYFFLSSSSWAEKKVNHPKLHR